MGNRLAGMLICVLLVGGSLVWFTLPGRAAESDISGTITSSNGPEKGVWVIAETTDLPTKFIKSVVTGDGGRYLIPDLPEASYKVWVRGYGLLDSAGVTPPRRARPSTSRPPWRPHRPKRPGSIRPTTGIH